MKDLFFYEEVELREGGYHTFSPCVAKAERPWSEPYRKSGQAIYKNRIVKLTAPSLGFDLEEEGYRALLKLGNKRES